MRLAHDDIRTLSHAQSIGVVNNQMDRAYPYPAASGARAWWSASAIAGLFIEGDRADSGYHIGGWRLTSNFNAEGGLPMAISGPCNELTCRPNMVGTGLFHGSRSKLDRINQWMNPAGF